MDVQPPITDTNLAKDKLYYLASPYSHRMQLFRIRRYNEILNVSARLHLFGLQAISPIVLCHEMATRYRKLGTTFNHWKRFNISILDRCDELLVVCLPGWEQSKGVAAEINHALSKGKAVKSMDPKTLFTQTLKGRVNLSHTKTFPQKGNPGMNPGS